MADTFQSIHFSAAGMDDAELTKIGTRTLAHRGSPSATRKQAPNDFETEEAAARYYLSNILAGHERPGMRGLTAPDSPLVVPDLKLRDSKVSPLTQTSVIRFVQTKSSIPVFGSSAVVELDRARELLSVDAQLAEVKGITPLAALSPQQAIEKIAAFTNTKPADYGDLQPPEQTFYHDDDKNRWHLAWFVRNVPAAPVKYFDGLKSHGHSPSLAMRNPQLDYLVDAHSGDILLYWSARPTLVRCTGRDEENQIRTIFGTVAPGGIALRDPLRRLQTIDFGGNSIDSSQLPTEPVCEAGGNFQNSTAAISAHYNAGLVSDFFRSVLMRDGVDDKGMEIISYVNCTWPSVQTPPAWNNAVWWKNRMWYGQSPDGNGNMRSFARHLDIIAHELSHGITEFTSGLIYLNESGALNESFSDIFGVIIKNWDVTKPDTGGDVAGWNWEIGRCMGRQGLPLRDMKDPKRTGDPDHMRDYSKQESDNGGVHTNSNIHNKAAYNLLNARDADGDPVLTPREVAVLYYLTLSRLDTVATFKQTRATLLNVAGTYLLTDPQRSQKLNAISEAYKSVGI